jgi:hypothetical protein
MRPSSTLDNSSSLPWQAWASLATVICATLALAFRYAPPLTDDAFITFRYAKNLVWFGSPAFNPVLSDVPGENVLGTSSPGLMLLLALAIILQFDPLLVSLIAGVLGMSMAALLPAIALWRQFLGWGLMLGALPILLLGRFPHAAAFSGLETGLYCALVAGTLLRFAQGKVDIFSGTLTGLAMSLRPDGAILLLIGLLLIWIAPRAAARNRGALRLWTLMRFLSIPLLGGCAWSLYALDQFGSIIPHSIEAKQVVHPGSMLVNATVLVHYLLLSPSLLVLFTLGATGLMAMCISGREGRTRYGPALMWLVLYAGGLIASGVRPQFFWYIVPLALTVGAFGIPALVEFAKQPQSAGLMRLLLKPRFRSILILGLCALSIGELVSRGGKLDSEQRRHLSYDQLATVLSKDVSPGDSVLLCEVGTIAYRLPFSRALDSAGLTSARLLSIRHEHRTGWFRRIALEYEPQFIVSADGWCEINTLKQDPCFLQHYTLRYAYRPEQGDQIFVYVRRENPPSN